MDKAKPNLSRTRPVNILHVEASGAEAPGGEKTGTVTLEHSGEIEQWVLTLRDTVLLSHGLLSVLQHHQHAEGWRDPNAGSKKPPLSIPHLPTLPTATAPTLTLLLKCENGETREIGVSGGYQRGSRTYLMYDFHARQTGSYGIMRIDGPQKLSWVKPMTYEHLPYDKWALFGTLRVGANFKFKNGTRTCIKVSVNEIEQILKDKTCTVTGWF